MDGCAIIAGPRCDDLLVSKDETSENYVELKGVDLTHASDSLNKQ